MFSTLINIFCEEIRKHFEVRSRSGEETRNVMFRLAVPYTRKSRRK